MLAFYLHLRASEKYAARPDLLKSHPILARLLTLKQALSTLEDLDFSLSDSEDGLSDGDSSDGDGDLFADANSVWDHSHEALEDLEGDEVVVRPVKKTKVKDTHLPKKKQKASKDAPDDVTPIFDLVEPEFTPTEPTARTYASPMDAYGEVSSLDYADAADKGARRKTLRFHTSKIESASARRQGARNAVAGDDDIPYRERKKARMETQIRKGLGEGGEDLDSREAEPQGNTKKRGRDEPEEDGNDDEGDDGYYDLVKKQKRDQKVEKKAQYEAEKEAAR